MSESRPSCHLSLTVAGSLAALFLFASALIGADPSAADQIATPIKPQLGKMDELATLQAVQIALTEAGDGSAYVWRRPNGRLSGMVKPTQTFRDADGQICRHLVISMTTGRLTRRTEGIACRGPDRVWSLDG